MRKIPVSKIIGTQRFQTGAEIIVSGCQTNLRARLDGLQQFLHAGDDDEVLVFRFAALRTLRAAGFPLHSRAAAAHRGAHHQDQDQRQHRR